MVIILGLIAGLMTTFSFLPQIIKIVKTKDVSSISLTMGCIYTLGVFCWLSYALIIENNVLLITNIFSLIFGLLLIYFKLKYKKKDKVLLMDVANHMFKGSKPLSGIEYEILQKTLNEQSKSKPTLKNRL